MVTNLLNKVYKKKMKIKNKFNIKERKSTNIGSNLNL